MAAFIALAPGLFPALTRGLLCCLRGDLASGAAAHAVKHRHNAASLVEQVAVFIAEGMAFAGDTITNNLEREMRMGVILPVDGRSRVRGNLRGMSSKAPRRRCALLPVFFRHRGRVLLTIAWLIELIC